VDCLARILGPAFKPTAHCRQSQSNFWRRDWNVPRYRHEWATRFAEYSVGLLPANLVKCAPKNVDKQRQMGIWIQTYGPTKQSPSTPIPALLENCCWCLDWILLFAFTLLQTCPLWELRIPLRVKSTSSLKSCYRRDLHHFVEETSGQFLAWAKIKLTWSLYPFKWCRYSKTVRGEPAMLSWAPHGRRLVSDERLSKHASTSTARALPRLGQTVAVSLMLRSMTWNALGRGFPSVYNLTAAVRFRWAPPRI
jgi:hypothetical protein